VTIALIIVGAIVVFVIVAVVLRLRSDDELDAGGSYGRQLGEDKPPEDA
jgi:preprotein translocase subunit SecG